MGGVESYLQHETYENEHLLFKKTVIRELAVDKKYSNMLYTLGYRSVLAKANNMLR